jgi:L-glutamine-phosphate cytidylyltransferase
MKAIIVAAGKSSRLYPLTSDLPKCLLEIDGASLIERSIDLLNANGVSDIYVVVGFRHEKLRHALGSRVQFVPNWAFAHTNNMVSLLAAIPCVLGDEFIYMHSDLIYHEDLLRRLVNDNSGADISLLVDFDRADDESMKVRVVDGRFVESSKSVPTAEAAGEWTGLARISARAIPGLREDIEILVGQGGYQNYDTSAFSKLAAEGMSFQLLSTDGLPWCEIDTHDDLSFAKSLFEKAHV